ncbi:hypothetical protein ABW19_dt0206651 [Dactylella cylindrospora]|nr:hypothetical protein ABW19_dt0206651 [Dactylella cylindrospora]
MHLNLEAASVSLPNLKFACSLTHLSSFTNKAGQNIITKDIDSAKIILPNPLRHLPSCACNSTSSASISSSTTLDLSPRSSNSSSTTSPASSSPPSPKSTISPSKTTPTKPPKPPSIPALYETDKLLSHVLHNLQQSASNPQVVDSLLPVFWELIYIVYFKQHRPEWVRIMRRDNPTPTPAAVNARGTPVKTAPTKPLPPLPHPLAIVDPPMYPPSIPSKRPTTRRRDKQPVTVTGWSFGLQTGRWSSVTAYLEVVFLSGEDGGSRRKGLEMGLQGRMMEYLRGHFESYGFEGGGRDGGRKLVAVVQCGLKICFFGWDGMARVLKPLEIGLVNSERKGNVLDLIRDAKIIDSILRSIRDSADRFIQN